MLTFLNFNDFFLLASVTNYDERRNCGGSEVLRNAYTGLRTAVRNATDKAYIMTKLLELVEATVCQ